VAAQASARMQMEVRMEADCTTGAGPRRATVQL
jgi:hypothetical protein